jgi:flavin reductase (DIM6/NTAB) family NADH-FMN oxidoreductase RutF
MDAEAKKTTLRMIPYGLYVLTAAGSGEEIAAATVNWVTQASFEPPLVVVGVKTDSETYRLLGESGSFALNMLGKGQNELATSFFKPSVREEDTINGERFRAGVTGSPILESTPAFAECRVVERLERGDHAIVVGEVVEAGLKAPIEGRIFYGG